MRQRVLQRFLATALGVLLASCGGGSNQSDSDASSKHYQMGGAIQGRQLTLANNVSTVSGSPGQSGSTDGTGATASLNYPRFITSDGTSIYITEDSTVRKLNLSTGAMTTLAGTSGSSGSADGIGASARFLVLRGITTDGTNLFVVDSYNNTIRKIVIATGVVSTIAGTPGSNGATDGIGAAAQFNLPMDITTDGVNLYVTEPYSHTVRKIVISTSHVSTLAGTAGLQGTQDGIGTSARFDSPSGITTDGNNVYVLSNFTIRRIEIAGGTVTTLAGNATSGGISDGIGPSAGFGAPIGITSDGTSLYVTDLNRVVRKIAIATQAVSTLAGSPTSTGSTDGQGGSARFDNPTGISTDGISLYIADMSNHTIRRLN